jgi:MFS family permease
MTAEVPRYSDGTEVSPREWLLPLIASFASIHGCMTGARLAAPLATLQLGGNAFEVGLLLALFSVAAVVLAFPSGRFVDRNGVRIALRISAGVAFFGTACVAIRPSLLTLAVAALCTGASVNLALVAMQRYAGRASQTNEHRKIVFSWLALGPAVSSFAGPFSTGFMLDHMGLRGAFAVLALLSLLPFVLAPRIAELAPVEAPVDDKRSTWALLREPGVMRLFVVNLLLSLAWDVHTFVVPVLGFERGLSASAIGSIAGAFAVAAICVRIVLPFIAARLQERKVLAGAMLASAAVFALYPFSPNAITMGVLSFALGLALGSVQPMVLSALHHMTPEHRHGEALGLRLTLLNMSSAVMPLIFGSLGAAAGVALVFWLTAAGLGVGHVTARRLRQSLSNECQ